MELRPPARLRHRPGRLPLALLALASILAALAVASGVPATAAADELEVPPSGDRPPAGYDRSADEVVATARATDEAAAERREHGALEPTAYMDGPGRWRVSFVAGDEEVAQVHVDDRTGQVLEAWTGPQVAWKMARGYEGAFGGILNAPYVWLPLCAVFLLPFIDPRRPFRMLHLDLLVLLAFGVSHVFFNRGEIFWSVPLVIPVLLYLLVRMLWIGFRGRERRERLVPFVPATALLLGVLFLVGLRGAVNVVDSDVIDVGYAGVIGADLIADGDGLYDGRFPEDIASGDTYGPVNYLAYLPFEQAFSWSGAWDDLPAAHAAALAFDALTILGLYLLGRRLRAGPEGRLLGAALAFAWASYPYTAFVLASNANDSLVAMLVVFALLAISSAPARGLLLGLAAGAKFAPAVLAPLFARGVDPPDGSAEGGSRAEVATGANDGDPARPAARSRSARRRLAGPALFALAFGATVAAAALAFVPDDGLREVYDRTVGYQAGRDSPFSVWGQIESLGWAQTAAKVAAVGLAVLVAFVPRRRGPVQVAALGGAVLLALQLAMTHWFYLYVVWFAPLVLVALFARHRPPRRAEEPPAPAAARAEEPTGVPA